MSEKEIEGKIGAVGSYEVDVVANGVVTAKVEVKVDLIDALEKLAAKSENKFDDGAVAMIKKLLGRE